VLPETQYCRDVGVSDSSHLERFRGIAVSVIDKYLKRFPDEQRESLQYLRETILSIVPQAKETLSYGMPAFEIEGKVVAGFDGFKNHCSYFPHSGSVLEELEAFPDWCEVSKGTLKFPIGKKLPKTLVRKLISVSRRQILEKQKGSSSVKPKK
jgi:uncharacterized protein YdhG (YjbR/CyaY superfamily)